MGGVGLGDDGGHLPLLAGQRLLQLPVHIVKHQPLPSQVVDVVP